ncbi:MAG TPA: DNA polymerase III subunit delta [Chthoniobacterales bacterium]|jgi:DNA polymerase-3 subunit delta|nr:DNA polymerase III subunit delta [Chthoniobacterales bacterium]
MATRKKSVTPVQETRVFTVIGSDEGEAKRRARELAVRLTPKEGGDFGVDTIDGAADNAEQAIQRIRQATEAIQTLPFFGSEKLVWLKNVNFLADTVTGHSAGVQAALDEFEEFLERGLPSGVSFLLSAAEVDKRRSFYKSLGKIGKLEQFDKLDTSRPGWEEDLEVITRRLAAERDLEFETEALQVFVRLVGADTRQLRNELEKIDLYLGENRTITVENVRDLVSKSTTGVIWELGTGISKRQLVRSLALLDQLLFQGETPIGILYAAIIPTVRNLLVAKDLLLRHKLRPPQAPFHFSTTLNRLPEDAIRHLPRKKDGTINAYALGLAAFEADRFELGELVDALDACLKANVQLVTTQLDPRLILGQLLVKLIVSNAEKQPTGRGP